MSAKLAYSFRDNENPDLHKQIGCMNGFFQLFDRHRRITGHGRRITNNSQPNTPLQSGQNGNQAAEANNGLEKAREKSSKKDAKEQKRRNSTESSRHSFSSSSCSSSTFSSLDLNAKSANSSSGTEVSGERRNNPAQLGRSSVDLRDVVKDCIRRESPVREQHVDSPRPRRSFGDHQIQRRLSYDGERESRDSLRSAPRLSLDSHRQRSSSSLSSPAGKPLLRDLRIEKRTVEQVQEPGSSRRASSVVAKLMGLVDPVLEPLPLPSPLPVKEDKKKSIPVEKRKTKKSVSMEGNSRRQKSIPVEAAPWRQGSLTVFGEIEKRLADLEFKKSGKDLRALKQILEAMQKSKVAEKEPKLAAQVKAPIVIMRPAKQTSSPRKVFDRVSGNSSPRSSPKKVTPVNSGLRKKRESPERKLRLPRSVQGSASPIQSESNLSLGSEDIEGDVTSSVLRSHQVKNPIIALGTNKKMAEQGRVTTPEQPSPVSVLDSTFYRGDESPSPVKKTLISFKDDELLYPDEDEWSLTDLDHPHSTLPRISSLSPEETSYTRMFYSETTDPDPDPDHTYISEILSYSGNSPIEPHMFFALEHHHRRSGIAKQRHEKLHRKLVFDVVAELIMGSERGSEENLLEELCSEVDRLRGNSSGEDRSESIVRSDMARFPMRRREYGRQVPAVVLDLERLIFKDLVTETINSLKARPRGLCKQMRFN